MAISNRVGHGQTGAAQAGQQLDQKRQRRRIATLDQGEHKVALLAADIEVAVLAAAFNTLKVDQPAQVEAGNHRLQLGPRQRGEHRHGSAHHSKIFQEGIRSPSGWSERT